MKIEARTLSFIAALVILKERKKMPSNKDLAEILGIKTLSTISEIKAERQNIQPDAWIKFMEYYKSEFPEFVKELKSREYSKLLENSNSTTANGTDQAITMNLSECRKTLISQQETIEQLSASIFNLTTYLGGGLKKKLP